MAAAQELVTKQGASPNIFLTTDDAGVIDKVRCMAEALLHQSGTYNLLCFDKTSDAFSVRPSHRSRTERWRGSITGTLRTIMQSTPILAHTHRQ
jgi:hypothetical protein